MRVPAHRVSVDGRSLEIEPYTIDAELALRTDTILRFEKNGPGSFSVEANPRYFPYLQIVDPLRSLPHFHLGWCTDFCDYTVMKAELEAGYQVVFIYHAAVGVGKRTTGQAMRDLLGRELILMTTDQFVQLSQRWRDQPFEKVATDLQIFAAHEGLANQKGVMAILNRPEFKDPEYPGDLGDSCALLWTPR
jgi:hypothetical protein